MMVLDLFSGIGGFALGFQRAGLTAAAFCEIDPFCRRVLAKHWPKVPCYDDVRTLTGKRLAADGIFVDVVCGGFPCQDISLAGCGAGIDGPRSKLWGEFARLIGEIGPAWVVVENVPALRNRGADRVLWDLEALGYATAPVVVGAVHAGAPHRRQRVWIVAHADDGGQRTCLGNVRSRQPDPDWSRKAMADADGFGSLKRGAHSRPETWSGARSSYCRDAIAVSDADGARLALRLGERRHAPTEQSVAFGDGWWLVEPDMGRVAHGVPARVDRLRGLGNAVVPQISEMIGRFICAADNPLSADHRAVLSPLPVSA